MLTESTQQVRIGFSLSPKEQKDQTVEVSDDVPELQIESGLLKLGSIVEDFLSFLSEGPHYQDQDVFMRGVGIVRSMRKVPDSFYLRYLPQNQYQVNDWVVDSTPNLWFALSPTYVVILNLRKEKNPKQEWCFAFKGDEIFVEKPVPKSFEVLDNGSIWIPNEKITVGVTDFSWPYIVSEPNFFLAYAKLEKMLTPYHSNYLTMLLADKQPNKGIGVGIADQLKEILELLKISSPKISMLQ